MRLAVREQVDGNWAADVERCNGTIYHTAEWARITSRGNSVPQFFRWYTSAGEIAAIACGRLLRSAVPLLRAWGSVMEFGSLPAVRPEFRTDGTALLASLKDCARSSGCRLVHLESHMCEALTVDNGALGGTSTDRIEFRLELGRSAGELWRGLSSHHRRKVRKAQKQNVSVRIGDSAADIKAFRELQKSSRDRRTQRGESMHLGGDEPMLLLIQRLIESGLGSLYIADRDGEIVSGAVISSYAGRAYYLLGGSSPLGFKLDAPALVFWEAIDHYRDSGFVELNLGGVPAHAVDPNSHEHGLYRFKRGFGGDEVACSDFVFDLRPTISATIGCAKRIFGRR